MCTKHQSELLRVEAETHSLWRSVATVKSELCLLIANGKADQIKRSILTTREMGGKSRWRYYFNKFNAKRKGNVCTVNTRRETYCRSPQFNIWWSINVRITDFVERERQWSSVVAINQVLSRCWSNFDAKF